MGTTIIISTFMIFTCLLNFTYATKECQRHIGGLVAPQLIEDHSNVSGLGEFPWTIGLFQDKMMFCGGSLIHPNVIITSAHCIKGIQKNKIIAKAGLWDTAKDNVKYPVQERSVDEIFSHSDYAVIGKTIINDIAIILLKDAFILNDHINIICLPKNETIIPNICFSNGWSINSKSAVSTQPKKFALPLMTNDICEQKLKATQLGNSFKVDNNFICAGGEKTVDSSCFGDDGSALACSIDGKTDASYILTGITSWDLNECNKELPGAYTKVLNYLQWINDTIEKKGFKSTTVSPVEN